ncbi:uncharacterized protein EI90DRAFT_3281756 [Cantharellus anzutake]|uniref:uncharacterized protein n=1 Tax=Cantharellus anzutake TaxID=1750568 RepID=UPI001905814D|nr:uncharacterized protein EI90DRAFT_3281756 [Cantharellus anzutake]KAF8326098.1 hypothetical protein EI90DRAFT_3281756 [Cantharellus anzutake]
MSSSLDSTQTSQNLMSESPLIIAMSINCSNGFLGHQLHAYLTGSGFGIANVTIIRDRGTGMSKSFGFAQFLSLNEAQRFLEPNFPYITLPPPSHVSSTPLNADDSRTRRVKIDYSQSANPDAPPRRSGPRLIEGATDGTRDIGSAHVPVILLRNMDIGSTLDTIAEALRGSEGPGRQSAKGMRRIILIKDRISKISRGVAFVEFVDVQSASIVLANTMSPTLFPSGFRISDKPVAASFAHPHSFTMLQPGGYRDENCVEASLSMGGQEGGIAKYWDDNACVSELTFKVEEPTSQQPKRLKEKKKEKPRDPTASEGLVPGIQLAPAPTALKGTGAPITLSFKSMKAGGGGDKPPGIVAKTSALGFSEDPTEEGDPGDANGNSQSANRANSYAKVAPMASSVKVAKDISKWNAFQAAAKIEVAQETDPSSLAPPPNSSNDDQRGKSPVVDNLEYADLKKLACFLCSRQFKSLDQLKRHNAESGLHKKNLADTSLVESAKKKAVASRQTDVPGATNADTSTPKYRDRALERRVIYGQPDVPVSPTDSGAAPNGKRRQAEGPSPPPKASTPPPALNPGEDENNVGNKLLKKMGWSAGTGLGLSGEGRVDPIKTALYSAGAGIGASKARPIEQSMDMDYATIVKETARQRYDNA